jgi:AcrR family transcriptional regulator
VVSTVADRPLRSDAARNAERILRAARDVYGELGPDAPIEAIARRAGVGERTLYRRFPTKGDLVRAALDQSIAEDLSPVIEQARRAENPLRGLTNLLEAALSLGVREHNILAAARKAGSLTSDVSIDLYEAMSDLVHRAQRAGLVRADLVAEDLPRIVAMLYSVLWTMDLGSDGWRRYVALMLDAMTADQRRRLPPTAPLRYDAGSGDWPL